MKFELKKITINIEENIIILNYKEETIINFSDANEIYKTVTNTIEKEKEYGLLTLGNNVKAMDREARDFFGNNPIKNMKFNAIVYSNIIQKLTGDLYLSLSNPMMETKFFTKEEEALKWLKLSLN